MEPRFDLCPGDASQRRAWREDVAGRVAAGRAVAPVPWLWLLIGLLLVAPQGASGAEAESENHCVSCHDQRRLPIALGHSFDEWRVSPHASHGVGCEKCHGGDASASDVEVAHRGVRPVSDPASMVHPRNLAATCGACHEAELEAYAETVHAKQVETSGNGATCMTCHGAMAASLPSPAEMDARCAVCHDQPLQARVALVMLAQAKIELHRTALLLDRLQPSEPEWHTEAVGRLRALDRDYAALQLTWHTFHMKQTLEESKAILKLVDLLDKEARVRSERGH